MSDEIGPVGSGFNDISGDGHMGGGERVLLSRDHISTSRASWFMVPFQMIYELNAKLF